MISKENTRVYITIPKIIYIKLKEEAEYEGRSISNLACKIIKDYYEEKEKKE